MKKFIMIAVFGALLIACKTGKEDQKETKEEELTNMYASFGDKITATDYISEEDAYAKYQTLKVGDTIDLKFNSSINEVCSKKGCWMKLPVGDSDETIMVRFKDYGFFMPLDSKGKEVIVAGKAFVKEVSVDELKHYAEDAGKSKEEIAKITKPKLELAFEANGVLLKE